MVLPDQDHIARTCKGSSVDPLTGKPTPASFAFRPSADGSWKDTYLSVNWLEKIFAGEADLPEKFVKLREFLLAEHDYPVMPPTKTSVLAAIKVATLHADRGAQVATELECRHEPQGDDDPHAGIHPNPGVSFWPTVGDAPQHLAVQLFLYKAVCHSEPAFPPAVAVE